MGTYSWRSSIMAINFPSSLDNGTSLPYPSATDDTNSPSLSGLQDNQNDALIALETKLGIADANSQTPVTGNLLASTATGESSWSVPYPASTIVGISDTQTLTNKTIDISNNTITNLAGADIASQSITAAQIANATITATQIANATITATQIANNTITNTQIADTTITATQIANSSVATLYNPYKFSVYIPSGSTQALTQTTFTTIIFGDKYFDTSNNYDATTGIFTAPIAGFYQFNARTSVGPVGGLYVTSIFHNGTSGTEYRGDETTAPAATDVVGSTASALIQLATGDTVQVTGFTSVSGIGTDSGAPQFFSGFLVSAT